MLERLLQRTLPFQRFAVGAAWFFIVVSLAHLGWAIAVMWGDPGLATLYQTQVDGEVHRAWGLAYQGWPGLIQVIGQALVVAAAATMSVLPWLRLRRLGHGILVAWSGLWAVNLLWLASLDSQLVSVAQAAVLGFLFACTVVRAIRGWSPRPRSGRPKQDDPASLPPDQVPELTAEDVPPSPTLNEVSRGFARVRLLLRTLPDRLRRVGPAARHRAGDAARQARGRSAAMLNAVADFTRRQAKRLAS